MDKIKVLIVDDSAFIRTTFTKFLSSDKIEVIGTANNGKIGVEQARKLRPDVITMDIEMPEMNGIEATDKIMKECPTNIIMISTLTKEGAGFTLEALSAGAVDFITKKPAFAEVNSMKEELIQKVIEIGSNSSIKNKIVRNVKITQSERVQKNVESSNIVETDTQTKGNIAKNLSSILANKPKHTKISPEKALLGKQRPKASDIKVVCIGISTGGPQTLLQIIPRLPNNLPVPIVIAQHMPPFFTKSLSERLNSLSVLNVKEAEDGDLLKAGNVYLCPGGKQTLFTKKNTLTISDKTPEGELYSPSVNIMTHSAIDVFGMNVVSIIMTGMGKDGSEAASRLQSLSGYVMAQTPETCIVAGMPQSALNANVVDEVIDLEEFATVISGLFNLTPLD